MSDDSQRWLMLAISGFAVILSMTAWFSATAILPELTVVLQLSDAQAGLLTNAVQLGFVVGAIGSSLLSIADIWPLIRIMALASLATAFFNALLLLEPTASIAVGLRFLTGVSLAMIYPPAMKFIATWFKTGRGLAMGSMVGALTLGSALPHLVRGLGQQVEWQSVIWISTLFCVASAGILIFFLREGPFAFAKTTVDPRQIGLILRNRAVMLANFGYFGHMWELYAMWGWFLVYVAAAHEQGLDLTNISIVTFAVIAIGAPGCIFCGWMADRIGRCYSTALMMAISGCSALLIGFVFDGPLWIFMIVAMIWGFTVIADSAQFSAAVTELSDQNLVGSALAFQMGVGFAITIFVIWLMPLVAEAMGGWRWAFLVLAPGPFIGALSMLALRRHENSGLLANGNR